MNSESSYGTDLKGLTASIRQLRQHLRRYVSSNPDLRNLEVRITPSGTKSDTKTEPDRQLRSAGLIIIIQADTAQHAEMHAQQLIDANEPGSTSCTSTGEAEVTCEYTDPHDE